MAAKPRGCKRGRRDSGRRRRVARLATLALLALWAALQRQSAALAAGVVREERTDAKAARVIRSFDVSSGRLADALEAFRTATGLSVVVDAPEDLVATLESQGVRGAHSDEEALRILLDGTGLSSSITGRRAQVRLAYEESVDVDDVALSPLAQSTPKYSQSLETTPQSIDVVPAEVLDQQATTSLRDALRNVAGISLAAGEGGAQGDSLTIRGFTARGDLHLDGMRDFGSYYRDPFATEEVQVLKGPSGLAFGRGATGGVVNQVTKLPRLERSGELHFQLGSADRRRLTLDLSEPLEKLGKGTALRVAVMGDEGGTPGRDVTNASRFGIAPSVAFGLGTRTRVTLGHVHQQADDVPDYGVPWYFDEPASVRRGAFFGFEDGDHLETDVDVTTLKVEHDVSPNVTLRNQLRRASYDRKARITEARLVTSATPETPLEDVLVDRIQIDAESAENFLQDQFDVTASLRSGRVKHDLVAGVEWSMESSSPVRRKWDDVPRTSLLDPRPADDFAGTSSVTSDVDTDATSQAIYAIDTIHATKRLSFLAGLRWDRFDVDYENKAPSPVSLDRVDEAVTWRAGMVFEPREGSSVYASVATSFNPSAEALSLSAATEDTEPERNRSFEIGTKWSFAEGRMDFRAAVFQTEKTDAREPVVGDPLTTVNTGRHRVKGFEIEAHGRPTKRWELQAGYARLDSEVVDSVRYPESKGLPLANVPEHTFAAWSTHELPWKLEAGWGVRHVSSRAASTTAPLDNTTQRPKIAPGYWTLDAMVSRTVRERWTLQLNVANLTDERTFDLVHPGHVVPGAGRNVTFGATFRWPAGGH